MSSNIYINTNNIQILDSNKDWKLIHTFNMGEAETIYSKEDANNMELLYAEYTENKNIILAGRTDNNFIIKKLEASGYVLDSHKWEKINGVKSPIYRIDEGVYGINMFNGFQIWSENKGIAQDIDFYLREIFTWDFNELSNITKASVKDVVKGKHFNIDISYGSTDTLHAMCSLEKETKLKYFPYIASERTQDVIALGDEMLYLREFLMKFRKNPYAQELAKAIKEDEEKQCQKNKERYNAEKLLLKKLKETTNKY